jgi:hypothetical protein
MLNPNWVIVGTMIGSAGMIGYLAETIQGKVRPNKVTFFMWALAPLIAFAAEIKQGVGIQSLMTFSVGFLPLLIFIASFLNKKARWKIGKFDILCGALSVLGLILWLMTKAGNIAIVFSIIADGIAGLPTVVKSYNYPETENPFMYLTVSISAAVTLLTVKTWNFANYAFPVYILIVDLVIFTFVRFKIGKGVSIRPFFW